MQVHLKLIGAFRKKLPASGPTLEIAADAAIDTVLTTLGIDGAHVHLVLVNGTMEKDRTRPLADGDELTVFPPVAGG